MSGSANLKNKNRNKVTKDDGLPPQLPSSYGENGSYERWGTFLTTVFRVTLFVYVFSHSIDKARQLPQFLDSTLGVPIEATSSWPDHCDVWTDLPRHIDPFILSHSFGYGLISYCFGSFWVAFASGVFDELIEYSFRHTFRNFLECWWDSVFLDVFGCNLLGCLIGYGLYKLRWGENSDPQWALIFKNHKLPWLYASFLIFLHGCAFVDCFLLKELLWIPPNAIMAAWRIFSVCAIGVAYWEIYLLYAKDSKSIQEHRDKTSWVSRHPWLLCCTGFCAVQWYLLLQKCQEIQRPLFVFSWDIIAIWTVLALMVFSVFCYFHLPALSPLPAQTYLGNPARNAMKKPLKN